MKAPELRVYLVLSVTMAGRKRHRRFQSPSENNRKKIVDVHLQSLVSCTGLWCQSSRLPSLSPYPSSFISPLSNASGNLLLEEKQRVFDELYSSDVWNKAHDEIQKQKRTDNCQLERVVVGLMFWSDSTHLAQFGHSSAWPVYLFFGNLSKYIRASPTSGACHPIVFIPPVSALLYLYMSCSS